MRPVFIAAPRYSISESPWVYFAPSSLVKPSRNPKPPTPCQTRTVMRLSPGASITGVVSAQSAAMSRQTLRLRTRLLLIQTWIESLLAVQRPTRSGAAILFFT